MQGVEAQRQEARERKEKWEAEELRGFALARANQTGADPVPRRARACLLCVLCLRCRRACTFLPTPCRYRTAEDVGTAVVLHERSGGRRGD